MQSKTYGEVTYKANTALLEAVEIADRKGP